MDQENQDTLSTTSYVGESMNKENSSTKAVTNEAYLIDRKDGKITDTGFRIIGTEDKGYAVTIGKVVVSEWMKTEEEARELITERDWKLIQVVAMTLAEIVWNEKTMELKTGLETPGK